MGRRIFTIFLNVPSLPCDDFCETLYQLGRDVARVVVGEPEADVDIGVVVVDPHLSMAPENIFV